MNREAVVLWCARRLKQTLYLGRILASTTGLSLSLALGAQALLQNQEPQFARMLLTAFGSLLILLFAFPQFSYFRGMKPCESPRSP